MIKKLWVLTVICLSKAEIDLGDESEEKRIDEMFGLHPNELFIEPYEHPNFNKHHFEKEDFNLLALLDRQLKF